MSRELEMRIERRIRMWILEQELERRKPRPGSATPSVADAGTQLRGA
jgi:hypothetical protein